MASNNVGYERISKAFEKVLNSHGYGFQYSVLKQASDLFSQKKSAWFFEASEFPVKVQDVGTRIDFILRHYYNNFFYLLAECKRANPALSNWCFARAPFVRRNRSYEPYFLEHIELDEKGLLYAYAKPTCSSERAYHVALEVKTEEKGDNKGQGRGAIEEAATQICRGLNGMIEFLLRNNQMFEIQKRAVFLPVIFTTAQIWASNVDLSSADIQSGKVDLTKMNCEKQSWVVYQYHMSPGLKHSSSPLKLLNSFGEIMDSEYIRTIPIVSPSGIESFFNWASESL